MPIYLAKKCKTLLLNTSLLILKFVYQQNYLKPSSEYGKIYVCSKQFWHRIQSII